MLAASDPLKTRHINSTKFPFQDKTSTRHRRVVATPFTVTVSIVNAVYIIHDRGIINGGSSIPKTFQLPP